MKVGGVKCEVDRWVKGEDEYVELCVVLEEEKGKVKLIESCLDGVKKVG